jgi:putative transcriptional regulator
MAPEDGGSHRIVCHLDRLLAERGMTLTELAARAGVTVVNLSVLKNDRARAVRFSTLTAVCDVLGCQPGDVLSVRPLAATGEREAGTAHGRDAVAEDAVRRPQ